MKECSPFSMNHTPAAQRRPYRWLFTLAVALVLTSGAVFASPCNHRPFTSLVVFGDSLSDSGRLYDLSHGGFPMDGAYWHGRQSNGPVWVEQLAFLLRGPYKLQDYAVVGALTAPTSDVSTGNVWSTDFAGLENTSLESQVNRYLTEHGGRADPHALYVLEGGANDLIAPLTAMLVHPPSQSEFIARVQALASQTISNVMRLATQLRRSGACYLLIVNLPDFSKTPRFVAMGGTVQQIVGFVVQSVNDGLAGSVNAFDAAMGTTTAQLDAAALVADVTSDPTHYGFADVTTAFMTRDASTGSVTFAAPAWQVWQWFFWDDLHPTMHGHTVFALRAVQVLEATYPASVHVSHGR